MVIQNFSLWRAVGTCVSVGPSHYGIVIDAYFDHVPRFKVARVYAVSHRPRLTTQRALHK
jgi:hypothetical protein